MVKMVNKISDSVKERILLEYPEIKVFTREDIVEELKKIVPEEGIPDGSVKYLCIMAFNPDYDPDTFSQALEESEEDKHWWDNAMKEMKKPGFDFVFNNTIRDLPKNSEAWYSNRRKRCPELIYSIILRFVIHEDGICNLYSEYNVDAIMNKFSNITEMH